MRRLKKNAVLSINLPSSTVDTTPSPSTVEQNSQRLLRLHNRSTKKEQNLNKVHQDMHYNKHHFSGCFEISEDNIHSANEEEINENTMQCPVAKKNDNIDLLIPSNTVNSCLKIKDAATQFPEVKEIEKQFQNVSVQVSIGSIIPKFSSFITTNDELSTMTGIPNFLLVNTIKKLVDRRTSFQLNSKFDNLEIIVMTFMKLKQNMSYALLAVFFKICTPETCRERILNMIDVLYACLKPAIYWPSKDNISRNMPQCLKNFSNVRAVIDCIEIPIQKFKNLCCQLNTYSYYKSFYTLKFMTAVTPAGLISFISKPYGGRSSDNVFCEQSGILKMMDKKDDLMADRGFTVGELCKKHDVNLIGPPFLKQKQQLSQAEAITGQFIAKARVHIERSNQRIKYFQILSFKMPTGLVFKSEEIFTIVCAVVNLSNPILKNDEF